ncbi:uncharacterized protein LOC131649066 [Vicia villosa]|uniref:uncharacterized protein LOC131649066 n=1 Tax=Vicia villosa TaxID=3911 RepID=UPI00273AEE0D|nr:uncharacterized protein LOC131649066 [Vicia villosa]
MSQSPSSKKSSPISETASGSRAPNVVSDQDVVLDVVPLNTVPPSDSARSQPRKMYARKSTGGSVPDTFSVQAQMPASDVDQGVQDDETPVAKDVETAVDNDETSAEKNDEIPVTKDVETSWKFVYQRRLALERELANDALENQEVMQLIKTAGRNAEAQPELEVTDNEVCNTITGGKVKKWPIKSKLSASLLTVKYALLHKIGSANWVPTNHTSTIAVGLGRFIYAIGTKTVFDYGTYIFDQTMRHAGTSATKLPIAFPSLICGIILKQYPGILKAKDSSADSDDDHAAGGDGEKMDADMDADSKDEYKSSSSSDEEMSAAVAVRGF